MKYKEIGLMFSDEYSVNVTLKEILTNEKTKFYEKVSSNYIIVIIVKEKNSNIVYKTQTENSTYFVK